MAQLANKVNLPDLSSRWFRIGYIPHL